ncbi:zinc finger HIT domain-containing protein 3 isoform X1 [Hydra vulgaris]|nr:zinc finger HIT domain-containing protein 3 [Hydra vulgaris]
MPCKISGTCGVCNLKDAIYRCPKCVLVYCSLVCYKGHKDSCSSKNINEVFNSTVQLVDKKIETEMSEDLLRPEVLQNLETSEHLKNMLTNKHLKSILMEIDASKTPEKHLENAMQIPIFTEFVDRCLSIVEPPDIVKIN